MSTCAVVALQKKHAAFFRFPAALQLLLLLCLLLLLLLLLLGLAAAVIKPILLYSRVRLLAWFSPRLFWNLLPPPQLFLMAGGI
jgi:hypothetical protein